MRKLTPTKAQLTLGDAPSVVLIVGLVFLVMATVALVGDKFGESVLGTESATIVNESVTFGDQNTPQELSVVDVKNVECSTTPIQVLNETVGGASLGVTNVTLTSSCTLLNATALESFIGNGTVYVSYTYEYSPLTDAYNATADLQENISDNTSIAGIILTISLVGIVLSILIGVFLGVTRRSSRV